MTATNQDLAHSIVLGISAGTGVMGSALLYWWWYLEPFLIKCRPNPFTIELPGGSRPASATHITGRLLRFAVAHSVAGRIQAAKKLTILSDMLRQKTSRHRYAKNHISVNLIVMGLMKGFLLASFVFATAMLLFHIKLCSGTLRSRPAQPFSPSIIPCCGISPHSLGYMVRHPSVLAASMSELGWSCIFLQVSGSGRGANRYGIEHECCSD